MKQLICQLMRMVFYDLTDESLRLGRLLDTDESSRPLKGRINAILGSIDWLTRARAAQKRRALRGYATR